MNHYTITATFVPLQTLASRDDLLASTLYLVESEVTTAKVIGVSTVFTVALGIDSDSDTLVIEDADRIRLATGMPPVDNVKVYRHGGRRRNLISEAR